MMLMVIKKYQYLFYWCVLEYIVAEFIVFLNWYS